MADRDGYPSSDRPASDLTPPPMGPAPGARARRDDEHECVFVEEQEPSGRLILPPCLVCGTTAMDALTQLYEEVGRG